MLHAEGLKESIGTMPIDPMKQKKKKNP